MNNNNCNIKSFEKISNLFSEIERYKFLKEELMSVSSKLTESQKPEDINEAITELEKIMFKQSNLECFKDSIEKILKHIELLKKYDSTRAELNKLLQELLKSVENIIEEKNTNVQNALYENSVQQIKLITKEREEEKMKFYPCFENKMFKAFKDEKKILLRIKSKVFHLYNIILVSTDSKNIIMEELKELYALIQIAISDYQLSELRNIMIDISDNIELVLKKSRNVHILYPLLDWFLIRIEFMNI